MNPRDHSWIPNQSFKMVGGGGLTCIRGHQSLPLTYKPTLFDLFFLFNLTWFMYIFRIWQLPSLSHRLMFLFTYLDQSRPFADRSPVCYLSSFFHSFSWNNPILSAGCFKIMPWSMVHQSCLTWVIKRSMLLLTACMNNEYICVCRALFSSISRFLVYCFVVQSTQTGPV